MVIESGDAILRINVTLLIALCCLLIRHSHQLLYLKEFKLFGLPRY